MEQIILAIGVIMNRMNFLTATCGLLFALTVAVPRAWSQQPPPPTPSNYTLNLTQFATHTGSHAIDVTAPRDGSGNLYVSAQSGQIFGFDSSGNSLGTFLDLVGTSATTGFADPGPFVPGENGAAFRGLMYFDFHPEYGTVGAPGEGKVYAGFQSVTSFGIPDYSAPGSGDHYVIGEFDASGGSISPSSYREVIRFAATGSNPHGLGQIAFNPLSNPGNEDYGLLYAAVGDAGGTGNVPPPPGYIQEIDNPFGKVIRIDPLQDGANAYSVPATNPFVGTPAAAEEVYALGFRDPQNFSFSKDADEQRVLVLFDIGAAQREEVDLVRPGANYGWVRHEGTSVLDPGRPLYDEFDTPPTPPVLEYDHATGGFAITGGLVVSEPGNPNFQNQVLFSDLVNGKVFHADYLDVLVAEQAGTQANIFESQVSFGGNTGTFADVLDGIPGGRGDARFGTDEGGKCIHCFQTHGHRL